MVEVSRPALCAAESLTGIISESVEEGGPIHPNVLSDVILPHKGDKEYRQTVLNWK